MAVLNCLILRVPRGLAAGRPQQIACLCAHTHTNNTTRNTNDGPKPQRYKEDLGNAVANFARMVPDGLLVFFPSYGVLDMCVQHWNTNAKGGCWAAAYRTVGGAAPCARGSPRAPMTVRAVRAGGSRSARAWFTHSKALHPPRLAQLLDRAP